MKDHPNFLLIFYEDMKGNIKSVIEKVSKFLYSSLSEGQVVDHLDIKNFKNNRAVNLESGTVVGFMDKEGSFIRKGKVGGWKIEFEVFPELEETFQSWVSISMASSSVKFPV